MPVSRRIFILSLICIVVVGASVLAGIVAGAQENISAPAAAFPADNSTQTSPLEIGRFSWQHHPAYSWYGVYLLRPDGSESTEWYNVGQICSAEACVLERFDLMTLNGAYEWIIGGYDPLTEQTTWGETSAFQVAAALPSVPGALQIAPENGLVTASWRADASSSYFNVYVQDATTVTRAHSSWHHVTDICQGTICRLLLPELDPTGVYVAYVQAWNPAGFSQGGQNGWAASGAVPLEPSDDDDIFAPQATIIDKLTPTDGAVIRQGNVTFQWRHDNAAQYYWIWVGSGADAPINEAFAATNLCQGLTCTLVQSIPEGDYEWWMSGWSAATGFGPWGEGTAFSVGQTVEPIFPVNQDLVTSGEDWGRMQWSHNNRYSWYGIYIVGTQSPGALRWFEAADVCSGLTCTADLFPNMITNGTYYYWMGGYNPTTQKIGPWGNYHTFSISIPSPDLPTALTHSLSGARPTLYWRGDVDATYYQVYIGTEGYSTTWYLNWVRAKDVCAGVQCAIMPEWEFWDGNYVAHVQAWSPGGYNLINADQWAGPYPFNMKTGLTPPLRQLAAQRNMYIGTALNTERFVNNDATHNAILSREFNVFTPENAMKWENIRPAEGVFDFSVPDKMVDYAEANGMRVRGHTLLWHVQIPTWLTGGNYTSLQLATMAEEHIRKVATHYRGRVYAWDVVNEAIDDDNGVRETIWWQSIGVDYVAKAFQWAHESDPEALLYYNDYNLEVPGARADVAYNMLRNLIERNIPVHGIGLQGHFKLDTNITQNQMIEHMRRFAGLGLQVDITEMDVRDVRINADGSANAEDLQKQANLYALMMNACLEVPECDTFAVWGISDVDSWIPEWFGKPDAALMWDTNFQPKPAYFSVQAALIGG